MLMWRVLVDIAGTHFHLDIGFGVGGPLFSTASASFASFYSSVARSLDGWQGVSRLNSICCFCMTRNGVS